MAKKESKEKISEETGLTAKQEYFCRCYTQNSELFGNATLSYAEAYSFDLDNMSQKREKTKRGKEILGTSEYEKAYNFCSMAGSRLIRNDKIQKFLRKCLNELLTDEVVDGELVKVILQNYELPSKVAAIREYNKLKKRITEKLDLTSKGKQIVGFNFVKPDKPEDDGTDNANNQANL